MDDDIEGLDAVLQALDDIPFTRKEKADIVEAGAKIAREQVIAETKAMMNPELTKIVMDFKKSKGGRYEYEGHLYEGVTYKPDEFIDGSTNLGFRKGYVTVAHWLNDGTYRQPATFFLNHAFDNVIENKEVEKAQTERANEILTRKGL